MDPTSTSGTKRKRELILVVFIFCCLLSVIRIVRDAPMPGHIEPDNFAKNSDQRFAAVKLALPTQGVVGYVGEPGGNSLPEYYLAQYALAPLVVDRSIQHKFVIGNFRSMQVPASLPGLRRVEDFGNGIALLTNEDAP